MPSILCIHHAPCNDGSAAAAALALRLHDHTASSNPSAEQLIDSIEVFPLGFGREWSSPIDEDYLEHFGHHDEVVETIYIVDISLSRERFEQVVAALRSFNRIGRSMPRVVCIDHHQSAIDRIEEISAYCDETYIQIGPGLSGATLVWNYFNQTRGEDLATPDLLRYVADQDVWEWKLVDSAAVNAALNTLNGYLPDMAKELMISREDPSVWLERRKLQGASILSVVDAQITKAFGRVWSFTSASGTEFRVVNATDNASQLGNRLCEDSDLSPNCVALVYTVQDDWSVKVSARTMNGGRVTARSVAEQYGGGGHDNAAGFRVDSIDELRKAIEALCEK